MTQIIDTQNNSNTSTPDLTALKARQQTMWASGDFAVIGTTLQSVGEDLCEAADVLSGRRVLDVACGNGNASLAAARRFAVVTGIDYVPALLARATERAAAERLDAIFQEGDAENLPLTDASFDYVLSTFGVMFAPDQAQAARELVRVCRVSGRIGLASWTPEGFLGELLRTVARYVPPPAFAKSPLRWGSSAGIAELFPRDVKTVSSVRKHFAFRYRSAEHFIEVFRRYYGPTHKAFEALDGRGQARLEADMTQLMNKWNKSQDALVIPAEYLEVVLERTA
jgi:ubiquinone/menaquinone biosynthesis C-methylase UbiE